MSDLPPAALRVQEFLRAFSDAGYTGTISAVRRTKSQPVPLREEDLQILLATVQTLSRALQNENNASV